MSRLRGVVALLAMMFVSMSVLAAEVAETVVVPAAEGVWYGNVQLWEIVGAAVVAIWGIVKLKYGLEKRLGKQVTEFLEMGARKTWDDYVRELKAGGKKLTAAQIKEARDKAWESAKEFAKAKGIDLAKKVAAERVPALLTSIVNRFKK